MDAAEFHAAVYEKAALIPPGKVTSYGHIAAMIGKPRNARQVGAALRVIGGAAQVPWQRIVSSTGIIVTAGGQQRVLLENEGVEVQDMRDGRSKVDMRVYGWYGGLPAQAQIDE